MSNAVTHNTAKASAKRDIQIDTTQETKIQTGEETGIDRELANINVSRTLNFVFTQMNQEYTTLLHLVDVRVAYFDGLTESRDEAPLPELNRLLETYVVAEKRNDVLNTLRREFARMVDYKGNLANDFVQFRRQQRSLHYNNFDGTQSAENFFENQIRVSPDFQSHHKITDTYSITVPGVIISADSHVMRTDGIVVDAFLGQGECLDDYSQGLQQEAVRERSIENDRKQQEIQLLGTDNTVRNQKAEQERFKAHHELERARKILEVATFIFNSCSNDRERLDIFQKIVPYLNGAAGDADTELPGFVNAGPKPHPADTGGHSS